MFCHYFSNAMASLDTLFLSQPAITCSKLKIETLEQGVKYVQSYAIGVFLVSLLLTWNIFHILF